MVNFNNFKDMNIHFIGIGGISMSALSLFCERFGANITGSDIVDGDEVEKLNKRGINVAIGHSRDNIKDDVNLVVYSGAISSTNPELQFAKEKNIPCYERSEFLGELAKMYNNSIVVAGTHGKTTTTAMIGEVFLRSNLYPSIHLGGESIAFGNYVIGKDNYFITEGCEYRNSIQYLHPNTSIITAIELDHTDCYSSYDEIENSFLNLANNTSDTVIVFENIDFSNKINNKARIVNVGFGEQYEISGRNLTRLPNGCYSFDVYYNGYVGKFQSNAVGIHNAKNTLCALALSLIYEIDLGTIYYALKTFSGVKRRFENVGSIKGCPIICDYAHHPTEIINSITTARQIYKDVLVVFQPHTYSRTIGLKEEFKSSFLGANEIAIFKTYPAREKYIPGGSARELFNVIKNKNKHYLDNKKALKNYLLTSKLKGCVLVLGAGDIYYHIKQIVKSIK